MIDPETARQLQHDLIGFRYADQKLAEAGATDVNDEVVGRAGDYLEARTKLQDTIAKAEREHAKK